MKSRYWVASIVSILVVTLLSALLSLTGILGYSQLAFILAGFFAGCMPAIYGLIVKKGGLAFRAAYCIVPIAVYVLILLLGESAAKLPSLDISGSEFDFGAVMHSSLHHPVFMVFIGYFIGNSIHERRANRTKVDFSQGWGTAIAYILVYLFLVAIFSWLNAFYVDLADPNGVQAFMNGLGAFALTALPLCIGFVSPNWQMSYSRTAEEKVPFGLLALLSLIPWLGLLVGSFYISFSPIYSEALYGLKIFGNFYASLLDGKMILLGCTLSIVMAMNMSRFSIVQSKQKKAITPPAATPNADEPAPPAAQKETPASTQEENE